ncbi:hypothetical protein [Mesobacterium pallidum]|uniref:hypothetical protein n=1 Tax=Mesobacterium pallidum TaxID=2872037 RepID=UPI001EE1D75C|nr:hypothetical protein [Mesobacterium pallidum]
MFESLTNEVVLSLATVAMSGLAICGTLVALRATQRRQEPVDLDVVVKTAPYHRLHNLVRGNGA